MKRILSWMMLTLLLSGTFALAFNVRPAWAQAETVYINSDGSVVPSSSPISSPDNVTYTFNGNISYPACYGIVVERSNIVIDGNGYTVQGNQSGTGLLLSGISNVTIKNTNIKDFYNGIHLYSSDNNTVIGNTATANNRGILLSDLASWDTIAANNITDNSVGLQLDNASNNTIYHNNFIGNTAQASADSTSLSNAWNDTYPSGGNYWSDYSSTDQNSGPNQDQPGSDGIGDIPHTIDSNNIDHYPLMNPYSVTISPSFATMDVDQSQLFTSTVSGGMSPYTYQWYQNGSPVSDATSNSWTFTPKSAGSYTVYVKVNDSFEAQTTSNTATITVNVQLSVSVAPSSVAMDVGQLQLFTSSVVGGTSPYTYQWYLTSAPVSGATSTTWTFTPNSVASYTVSLRVTDSVSAVATSSTVPVSVNGSLSITMAPVSVIMDLGQSQLFTSTISGGTLPFAYQWYLNGAAVSGVTSSMWTFTPSSSGSNTVCVNVTDNVGVIAESNIALVTVNPPLSVSVSPTSVVMDVGQSRLFTSTVSGGTFPYTYQWYLGGLPASGATSATWAFTPSLANSYTVYVKVHDTAGVQAVSNAVPVTVYSALSVTIAPTSAVKNVGQSQLFTCTVSGGAFPYSYQWCQNGASVSGATSATWTFTPASSGSYTIYLNVTDIAGFRVKSNTATITVNGPLSVTLSPTPVTLDIGQSQLFNSSASGGSPPYTYQWYLSGLLVSGATSATWTFIPSSAGSYMVYAKVNDTLAAQATSNTATVTVNPREYVKTWPMFHHDLTHSGYSTTTAPNTNQTLWSYTTGSAVGSSAAVVDGKVYIGSGDYKVYALNASNGAFIWSYTTGANVFSSPAVTGGLVYVGSDRVYALNASSGALVWSYATGGQVYSSPAVADGRVYVGSGYNVYALNTSTGALVWSYATGFYVFSCPAVFGGVVYVGSYDDRVYALNASSGALVWSYATGGQVYSSPAVADGKVFVGSTDNKTYAFDASTGALVWSYTTGRAVYSSPAVVGGVVYVGSYDDRVYALNASNGAFIWSYTTDSAMDSSPAVADGKVFVGSGHRVYALNASTGALAWSYTTFADVDSSPSVADGVVYVGSYDDKVYAFHQLPPFVSILPSSVVLDVGQSRLFISNATGGTSPYSYQWYLNGTAVSGASSPTWTFTPTSAASYTIYLKVTDSTGAVATSNTVPVTVNGLLSISVTPSSATMDMGQSQSFTSTVSGGISPFAYQWYLNGTAVPSATNSTWTFTPSSPGLYKLYANVTDGAVFTAKSNIATVTVNQALSVTVSPTSVVMDVGQSKQLMSTVSGGTSPYAYQWYLNSLVVSGANSSSWTFAPTSAGSYTVYVKVNDTAGTKATSNNATVTVNSTLSVSILPSSTVMDVGQSKIFTSNVTRGTSPYTYQWYLNGALVSGANSSSWTFAPSSSGSYTVYINATDNAALIVKSNTASVTVNPALSVTVSPTSVSLNVGQSQVLTSTVSGGTLPYTYQWYLNGAPVSGATSATWTFTPSSAGFCTVYAKVNDTTGAQATSSNATVTVNGIAVSISPSSVVMDINQSKQFASTVSGGTPPYTYQWYLNSAPISGATNVTWTFNASSAGSYAVYLKVNDTAGAQSTSNTASVTVNGPRGAIHDVATTSVTSSKTVVGQGFNVSISVTVADQGNYTEAFNVTAYANTTSVASQNVTLSSGNSTTITFIWNTTGFAYGNYTLSAYAWPVLGETNTTNNNCTYGLIFVTIPGDIGGDFKVRLTDLVNMAMAYGSKPGQPRWNPNTDIDGNGIVGLSDLTILALHYGQHYP